MEQKHVAIKVWPDSRTVLRIVAAMSGRTMAEVVDRLVRDEYARLNRANRRAAGEPTDAEPRPNAENRADL